MSNQFIAQYIDQVAKNMILDQFQRKQLLSNLQNELEDQLDGTPVSSYEELVTLVGPPEQLAETLSELEPYTSRIASARSRKNRLIIAIIVAIVITVGLTLLCAHIASLQPGYYSVSDVIVE